MKHQILLHTLAMDEFSALPTADYERVREVLRSLAQDPPLPGSLILVGRAGYHLRVGDYRILYEIDEEQASVLVLRIIRLGKRLS